MFIGWASSSKVVKDTGIKKKVVKRRVEEGKKKIEKKGRSIWDESIRNKIRIF